MIGMVSFDEGVPIHLELSPDKQAEQLLRKHVTKIKVLQSGDHDITPLHFSFRHFDYMLSVQTNGNATLYLTARHRNVVTAELKPGGFSRPSMGDKAFRFPEDLDQFGIAGPNDKRKLAFWRLLVYLPGLSPV